MKHPDLFLICGHVGAGKTTVARLLGQLVDAPVASVDASIKRLFPHPSFEGRDAPPSPDELAVCYNFFSLLSEYLLRAGKSVIIDGAFAKVWQRELLVSTGERCGARTCLLYVHCPDVVLKDRVEARFAAGSGVGFQAHLQIKQQYEPLTGEYVSIDTSKNVKEQLESFLKSSVHRGPHTGE